ncbi:PorP/SprF family type IX secretion system membrane protein [Litoribacter populi]|uniref:PorP/SprF family type IX secretion system membrane protein n=1 Tax=Litoribacter populi TaxID=2598460 RepID=UPI00117DDAEE|nr:PorP/SprF family type IX secretion system membrane protein [Litoribacter populi]
MARLILLIILIGSVSVAKAQDFHYSQFYAAPLYLNPAMTGATDMLRVGLNYRKQWPGLDFDFNSYSAYVDYYNPDIKSGYGVSVTSFQESNWNIQTTDLAFLYSYNLSLSESVDLRFGSQASYVRRNVMLDELLFGDQVDLINRSIAANSGDVQPGRDSYGYVDLSFGGLLSGENFWMGLSAHHLNRPSLSFYPDLEGGKLPIKYSVHTGLNFPLSPSYGSSTENSFLLLANYKQQGTFMQLDFGGQILYGPLITGIGYRGIPGKKGLPNQDSIILTIGFALDSGMILGYSYDYLISPFASQMRGAHEVSLRYLFLKENVNPKRYKGRKLKCFNYLL